MRRDKPNIGVTGPDKGGTAAWWFTRLAIWLQGGRAVRLRPGDSEYDGDLHGLVLGGGADINPEHYGQDRISDMIGSDENRGGFRRWMQAMASVLFFPIIFFLRKILSTKRSAVDKRRDELEFTLLEEALEKELPVLGICRGAQLINIRFGGNLYQNISDFYSEIPRTHSVWPKKKVVIDENSKLFEILGHRSVWVNALHKQAVNKTGERLSVVAIEESGVTQGIEHEHHRFLIGVQWHPEYLPQLPPQRRLFRTLVKEAGKVKQTIP